MSDTTGRTTGLDLPHHDGSELYVSDLAPRLGDTVTVWVRVPRETPLDRVHARVVHDAEPHFVPLSVDRARSDERETWWRGRIVVHNPTTSYRFILAGGPTRYAWLNAAGVHRRDVPDTGDFRLVGHDAPPPAWAREAVVYQVFPDRFARSRRAVRRSAMPDWAIPAAWGDPVFPHKTDSDEIGHQLYGGDLDGVTEHLDHVEELGADVVYLTPVFPGQSNHRYDAATFDAVDPVLGGDAALRRLTDAAHGRGLKVVGDFTTNHTGVTHEWFRAAEASTSAPERDFYFWLGRHRYVSWLGVETLPKLDWSSAELRRRVLDDPQGVVRKWLGPDGGLDGWRVDVANMTGRQGGQDLNHEVMRLLRAAVADADPQALLVGEHTNDYTGDVDGEGWHGVMNYAGFGKPMWTWLCDPDDAPDFLGQPVLVPRLGGEAVVETIREFTSHLPWTSLVHSFNLVGSHDTTRIRSLVGADSRLVDVAAGLLMTFPGIPMLTYGDEIGMEGTFGEDGRRTMQWSGKGWDRRLFEVYRSLIALRKRSRALTHGGLRWVHAEEDALVYLREAAGQSALVHVARAEHEPIVLDAARLPGIGRGRASYGDSVRVRGDRVTLSADGPGVGVRVWSTPAAATSRGRRSR